MLPFLPLFSNLAGKFPPSSTISSLRLFVSMPRIGFPPSLITRETELMLLDLSSKPCHELIPPIES